MQSACEARPIKAMSWFGCCVCDVARSSLMLTFAVSQSSENGVCLHLRMLILKTKTREALHNLKPDKDCSVCCPLAPAWCAALLPDVLMDVGGEQQCQVVSSGSGPVVLR